jgi:hypothetical protein
MVPSPSACSRRCARASACSSTRPRLKVLDRKAADGVTMDTLWTLLGDRRWIYFVPLTSGDSAAIEKVIA